ncbi:hemicentin-1, partial [Biomphalaria glabrata]
KCREFFHCINIRARSGKCYIGKKCPYECPLDTWGVNCLYSCSNCLDACDKFNGSCNVCMDGFDSPQTSCNK